MDKKQTTVYITEEVEQMINKLLFLKASRKEKTSRSELFSQGLKMVYDMEFKKI